MEQLSYCKTMVEIPGLKEAGTAIIEAQRGSMP
jgi:hypothetical protein